ncbi:hypothetical protein DFP83_10144 [Idiomarina fontislapidosi]|uniref:Uncharacterized protein n=1 Tax=Idiomarina fontislapidosi TaxID=263723 RepID=A0A432YAQ1_9GAMM|nr:hypothetical protein [Idiomarina fontislapidosi]PYE35170.1 hypothetical protein DFP83_10144 [Idiomarina fontislapidosi]RUO58065.1 hypothetical protein CWE25_00235 [Idiomarina fontislapidosi]|tara:strand:- start:5964 stop:6311 length:348 start_codon:yes stop_codon:yes gene_type:complete
MTDDCRDVTVIAGKVAKRQLIIFLLRSVGVGIFSLFLLVGFFSLFGFGYIDFFGTRYRGFSGFLMSLPAGLIAGVGLTLFFGCVGLLGLWVTTRLKPLKLSFRDVVRSTSDNSSN